MWSYYGSKSRIVNLYPAPVCDKIIEPFAGSARYSLKYWERDIVLYDKYDVIIKVWQYLQQCIPNDILSLPVLTKGLKLNTLNLSEGERLFLGLNAGIASTMPRNTVSAFSGEQNGRKNKMKHIADNLHKIKHWKIIYGSYIDIPNESATCFIDPPYQFGGHAYKHSNKNINFTELGPWCEKRKGQAIVCENSKADWMPFNPLTLMRGANMKHTIESMWTNLPPS